MLILSIVPRMSGVYCKKEIIKAPSVGIFKRRPELPSQEEGLQDCSNNPIQGLKVLKEKARSRKLSNSRTHERKSHLVTSATGIFSKGPTFMKCDGKFKVLTWMKKALQNEINVANKLKFIRRKTLYHCICISPPPLFIIII